MPHINRIRVNNVKYNFGTQFYDDFVMRFDGRNALYDLANGGGKSVLMLLLFQNLIPNCTLDDKQPVEKLFRTGDGSTTIHSLVEWKLDEKDIKDDYKYMLTGFCARKAKDDSSSEKSRDVASIDYFNYVIFYREYNDNDIINLPLRNGRERITYGGLRAYLKALGHSDYSLNVHIFERKGEYQRFISRYGLYESAWEIVRGINKTEGHVRTWFESNFKTTRKVIEDLLIEEIIQKAFLMKAEGQSHSDMARTLMEIKDRLLELSKKKEEISGYEYQIEALENFAGRIRTLDLLYKEEQNFYLDLVKTYNTASNVLRQKEKEVALANKEKDLYSGKIGEITRRLETAKVQQTQDRLAACEADTGKYDEEIQKLRARQDSKRLELNMKQSINNYIDYVEYKKKAEGIRHIIDDSYKDHGELLTRLRSYALQQKHYFEKNEKLWTDELLQCKKDLELEQTKYRQNESRRSAMEKELAVAESELMRAKSDGERFLAQIQALAGNVNSLLVEGSEREIRNNQIERRNISGNISIKKENIAKAKERIHEAGIRREAIRVTSESLKASDNEFALFEKAWQQKKAKADKLMDVYHAKDYRELKNVIYERWQRIIVDLFEKRRQASRIKTFYDQLSSFQPMLADQGLKELMDYIRRCHGVTCMLGSDYIAGLDIKERQALLSRMPYLPCSVIVQEGFTKLAADHILEEKEFGENLYPIVGLDVVLGSNEATIDEHVLFLSKNKRLFYDEKEVKQRREALKSEADELRRELLRLEDTSKTYVEDAEYLGEFIVDYYDKYVDKLAVVAKNREQLSELLKEDSALAGEISELEKFIDSETENIARQTERMKELEEECQALEAIAKKNQDLDEAVQRKERYGEQVRSLNVQINQLKNSIEESDRQIAGDRRRIEFLEGQRAAQEKKWQEIYSGYYEPESEEGPAKGEADGEEAAAAADGGETGGGEAGNGENADRGETGGAAKPLESSDDIDSAFCGLKDAFEKEHMDMDDKRQLLESYEQTMERLKEFILERGIDLEELAQMREKGTLMPSLPKELEGLREELAQLREELQEMSRIAEGVRADKNRLAGRIENAILAVEEKYGSFEAVDIKDKNYDYFMKEQNAALENMRQKLTLANETAVRGGRELHSIEDTRKDLERLMRTARVTYNMTRDFYADGSGLRKRCEELLEQYERLKNEEVKRREAFEKHRDQLADLMLEQKSSALADEIRYHMELPKNADEARELEENIRETVQIIRLEKDRIHQGIKDMVQIKESFEDQCLQRCLDIKTELERLPGLSKIMLDGQLVPMLQLKIPYVREEFYKQRMSEYIDTIVVNADSYKDFDDKLKYIRQKLAWKNLFSVIVTDMNRIRLNLYKRERIHEQSRYLKYEEAVGSTGQSQGIYIQFLIAVINYISALYSKDGDGVSSGKVIFIDNPFGAAKDIYIWEPIFKLLKTNHVQMIVPARGATPAISGMFDVNYTLGQKMIDGKVQTVVVDYYSNIKIDDMEYVKIDFEQEVFDFI